jgi:hypothetical protein
LRQSIFTPYFDNQSITRMTSKPYMLNIANFTSKLLPSVTIGQFSTHFLQVTASLIGVAMHMFCSSALVLKSHSFTNMDKQSKG